MPPREKETGAKDAAVKEEDAREAERGKSTEQRTAEQSTQTAENAGARKMKIVDGRPVFENISTTGENVSESERRDTPMPEGGTTPQAPAQGSKGNEQPPSSRSEYDNAAMQVSQGTQTQGENKAAGDASVRSSMIVPVTGPVNAEGAKSREDVREVIGPNGEKILVSPNRAVAGAIDTPNIIQEPDGRLVSPFQPNKHSEVEITGGGAGGNGRGVAPRARLIRAVPTKLSDEMIEKMSAAELRAVAHDRGYAAVNGTGSSTVRAQFRAAQIADKHTAEGENGEEVARQKAQETFNAAQEKQKKAVEELERAQDELKEAQEKLRGKAEGGEPSRAQEIKPGQESEK